ncbi:MAG: putative porin [Prosthecobacter sp.]
MLPIPQVRPLRAALLLAILTVVQADAQEPALPAPLLAENTAPATAVTTEEPSSDTPVTTPIPVDADPSVDPPLLPVPDAPAAQPILAAPSQNVTLNLINRLVQKGILTHVEAADLIKGAEEDAAFARAQAQALAETQAAVAAQNVMPPVEPDSEEVRVTYIPESVKAQIRDQLRTEVFAQAREQHWAAPNTAAEWTQRIKLFGDLRMRYDQLSFPAGNDNVTGAFPNFNLLNTGRPFDFRNLTGLTYPQINVDRDRERTRLRMRLGFDIDLEDGFTAGIRMATGGNNSPVSVNQTLGSANSGAGGGFSKYELWLDRAFIKYEASLLPQANVTFLLGRFDNPFMNASTILWDEDVGLDGFAFRISSPWTDGFKTFVTAGAFPVFNTALNMADYSSSKTQSVDKYLVAAQFGVEFEITDDIVVKSSIAYYDWENIEGRFSSPFVPASELDAGDTDDSRPLFAQQGNTYRPIRNITPTPGAAPAGNLNGTINQFQYFGLATKFRQIVWNGRVDFNHWEPFQVSLLGEFVKNVGLDKMAMSDLTVRNAVVNNRTGGTGAWAGGDTAWYMGVNFGKTVSAFEKRGDWALSFGYRYVESDAVVDAFTDSNFGGGATNVEGYTLNAAMALSKRTMLRASYMSSNEIAGPAHSVNYFLIDFGAKF